MKRFAVLVLLSALPAVAQVMPAQPGSVAAFDKTRTQIKALLDHRTNPKPMLIGGYNPFLAGAVTAPVEAPVRAPEKAEPEAAVPQTDAALLEELVAGIRISGTVERDKRLLIIVNQQPRRQGDSIIVTHNGEMVNIQVKSIQPNNVVFGLREAEVSLKF